MSEEDHMSLLNPDDHFEIGGHDLFGGKAGETAPEKEEEILEDIRIRVGTLLKIETVSFLLGAGVSVDCGGPLLGKVPLDVEKSLQDKGITGGQQPRVRRWLKLFYLAAHYAGGGNAVPVDRDAILERKEKTEDKSPEGNRPEALPVNFEQVLALLHRWRSALPRATRHLRIDGSPPIDIRSDELDACLTHATHALASACLLPMDDKKDSLSTFKIFLRKLLTRPLNLKRVNLFTLNYDTLVEQAADAEGIVLLDGFTGTQRRIFRPESYEQDLYFPAETTEGRVHRLDRVVHLYKLHGSITWIAEEPAIDNPYGVVAREFDANQLAQRLLIYPTPLKYGEVLGMPYAEMFRRFATALVRPQSVLFVVGYGFGDEHVNAIIRQALAVPSFTLVVIDPTPASAFVTKLRKQKDQRVWIVEGDTLGKFCGFVEQVLPDLRDEEIRRKVLATHHALLEKSPTQEDVPDGD